MLQLYNENIMDLLTGNEEKLSIKMDKNKKFYVKGLTHYEVKDEAACMKLLDTGSKNKNVESTDMNAGSSRSHCIFSLTIETSQMEDGEQRVKRGKLNLVDLAGSERQKKTNATGDRLKEAKSINLSLTNLGSVISALVDGKSKHIPYRNSKLTLLLEDSLGGNAKTLMFAAIGPADYNYDETMNTLRYANRAKKIKNAPKVNRDPKDAKIKEMQDEIEILRQQLQSVLKGTGISLGTTGAGGEIGGDQSENLKNLEEQLRQEAEDIEKQKEEERQKIMAMKNIDKGKREQLMKKLKEQSRKEDQEREHKKKLVEQLKEKEQHILHGQQKNSEELEKYNSELEMMRTDIEERKQRQKKMQEDILNAQSEAAQIKGRLAGQKDSIAIKNQKLIRLQTLVEQRREELEEMHDAFNAEVVDIVSFQS